MAKPTELYQGGAPSSISQMGSGLAQTGANIGASYGAGYSSIGQGIGSIGSAIAGAYAKSQTAKASNDIVKGLASDPKTAKLLGLDSPEAQDAFLKQFNQSLKHHGQYGTAQAFNPYLSALMQDVQMGREYANKIRLAQATAQAQFQYSRKAVPMHQYGGLNASAPIGNNYSDQSQTDTVTGNMDLNAPDQGGADQNLPLFGGQPKTGISNWFSKTLTPGGN